MTLASVQQTAPAVNITRERVAKIVRQMKDDYGWTGPEFNAVCKASFELEAGRWIFDPATGTLTLESRTSCNKRYRVTEHTCCEAKTGERCKQAGKIHWHSAAWSILRRASQPELPAAPPMAYADVLALCDELC